MPVSQNMTEENARKVKSVVDRLKVALGGVNDGYMGLLEGKSRDMGETFGCDEEAIELFTESVIRGTPFFSLSMILKKIDSEVRTKANLSDWLVIS